MKARATLSLALAALAAGALGRQPSPGVVAAGPPAGDVDRFVWHG